MKQYSEKKAAKGPKPAAKSMVSLDVKPWGKFARRGLLRLRRRTVCHIDHPLTTPLL